MEERGHPQKDGKGGNTHTHILKVATAIGVK